MKSKPIVISSDSSDNSSLEDVGDIIINVNKRKLPQRRKRATNADDILSDFEDSVSTAKSIASHTSTQSQPLKGIRKFAVPIGTKRANAADLDGLDESVNGLWIDLYKPKSVADIALHGAKIKQVREAIKNAFLLNTRSRVICLTGPSGCGKTAVVEMLADELDYEICEWVNPIDANIFRSNENDYDTSITDKFIDFLSTAGKCNSLHLTDSHTSASKKRKLVLVEDIPNISHYPTRMRIHSAITAYITSTRVNQPLIFIISRVSSTESSSSSFLENQVPTIRNLIPQKHLLSRHVSHITFNPIAPGILTKALVRLVSHFSNSRELAGSCEDVALCSGGIYWVPLFSGDIRCAVNALQFMRSDSSMKLIRQKSSSKPKRSDKHLKSQTFEGDIGGRETSLVLFHSLGKILQNKRVRDLTESDKKFNKRLDIAAPNQPTAAPVFRRHTERPLPLLFSPEAVFESAHTSASTFVGFLFQNYPTFYACAEEVDLASEWLSSSDLFTKSSKLECYSTSTAMRGLLFSHTEPVPKRDALRQIRKPEEWAVSRDRNERIIEMRSIVDAWSRNAIADGDQGFQLFPHYDEGACIKDILPFAGFLKHRQIGTYPAHWLKGMTLYGRSAADSADFGDFLTERDEFDIVDEDDDIAIVRERAAELDKCLLEDDILDD